MPSSERGPERGPEGGKEAPPAMVQSFGAGAGAVSRFFPARFKEFALAGWFHPLRRSGIMVTRNHSAPKHGQKNWWIPWKFLGVSGRSLPAS